MNTCNATQQIPKRPDRQCPEVVDYVAKKLQPLLASWLRQQGDDTDDRLLEEIGDMLTETWDWDGYALAKYLDGEGWSPDEHLVEELGRADSWGYQKHKEIIKLWVKLYDIKPAFKVGDEVKSKRGYRGSVSEIRAEEAQYVVACGGTNYIFNYEDVEDGKENTGTEGAVRN